MAIVTTVFQFMFHFITLQTLINVHPAKTVNNVSWVDENEAKNKVAVLNVYFDSRMSIFPY